MRWLARPIVQIAVIVAVLLVVALILFYRYRSSPAYSLNEVAAAVRHRDVLQFQKYVDVDRAGARAVDDLLAFTLKEASTESSSGWAALGAGLGAAMIQNLRPALVSTFRSSVLESIERGLPDSLERNPAVRGTLTTNVLEARLGASRRTLRGLTKFRELDDKALVGLKLFNVDLDTTLVLNIAMERAGNHWRVIGFENLPAYLESRAEIQRELISAANVRIIREMQSAVVLLDVRRKGMGGYLNDYFNLSLYFHNHTGRRIAVLAGTINTPEGGEDFSVDGTLEPNGTGVAVRPYLKFSRSSPKDRFLRYGSLNELRAATSIRVVSYLVQGQDKFQRLAALTSWDDYLAWKSWDSRL